MMNNKERIRKWRKLHKRTKLALTYEIAGLMLDMLEQQQAEIDGIKSKREWISVNERLPKAGKRVLIRRNHGLLKTTAISFRRSEDEIALYSEFNDDSFTCDCWDGQESNGYVVTHWQPLPEPPEDE